MNLVRAHGPRAALLLGAALLAACSEPNALLLKVSAERKVDNFDFTVRDLTTRENVAETKGQALPADQDISQPGKELKLAVRFIASGTYLVHIVGRDSVGVQVAARSFRVEGAVEAKLKLVAVPPGGDQDGDAFPSPAACAAMAAESFDCTFADCNDTDPRVNPLATERCNGRDDDCDGQLGPDETDADGDGFLKCLDCDPSDETDFNWQEYRDCRDCDDTRADVHPASRRDPTQFPAAAEDCTNCGDGIDHNCDGTVNPCNDADCDGWPGCGKPGAPPPPLCDCNDSDPAIHPGTTEVCGDHLDNNCDGQTDEGCMPCDVDGDGFMRDDPANGCNPAPGQVDCDDTDAGIFPGAAASCGGNEGGCREVALRGYCYRDTQGQVTIHDCNRRNAANEPKCPLANPTCSGCPNPVCDRDGDGFMRYDPANGCNPPPALADCDDDDPHTFPGAPDKCGDGKAQNCNLDTPCSDDADGDGYNKADDCDDDDPNVHPWATEKCNGKDDDCDGLTDEGNPDSTTGQTVAGTTCTDSDVGECGKKQGACICSRQTPVGTRNSAQRHACKDEALAAVASPRCFGAAQPQQETAQTCDGLDEDCDGVPDDAAGEVPCATGTACKWTGAVWKCGCDAATGCSGCCMHASPSDYCVYIESVTVGQCGHAGEDCRTCNDANSCTVDTCDVGVCHNTNYADHASCPGGQCRVPSAGGAAQCCGTCWLGNTCAAGADAGCGAAGGDCLPPNTACGTCRVCNGAGACGNVSSGQDPNNQCSTEATSTCGRTGVCDGNGACALYPAGTSCATCKTCDGGGTCGNVANGQDPNNECTDEGGCGHDGQCNGGGACRYYPATKSCGTCSLCSGSGACSVMPADDAACGTIDCSSKDTTCRNYPALTTNRCKTLGACKTVADCTVFNSQPNTVRCGTCQNCNGAGDCSRTPADDPACGTINCDGLDNLPCADYLALTSNRCKAFGACKTAPTDCTSVNYGAAGLDCGVCVGCNGTGTCNQAIGDDADCGTIACSTLSTACRTYSNLTANRCKAVNTCKAVNPTDCTVFADASAGTDCGVCVGCNGTGACNQAIADDADCGTIACSTLSTTCRTYSNLVANRCKALNTCKAVNPTDCTVFANAGVNTDCGLCMGCDGSGACGAIGDGADPNNDCGICKVCNGGGACRNVSSGDPKNNCDAQPASSCGTTGDCSGGACALWASGTDCSSCHRCDGAGNCNPVPDGTKTGSCGNPDECCAGACCTSPKKCTGGVCQ